MIKQLEEQIRDLERELPEVWKEQNALRIQPCSGDSGIREKEGKLENLEIRARNIDIILQDLRRKRQRLMSQSILKEIARSRSLS